MDTDDKKNTLVLSLSDNDEDDEVVSGIEPNLVRTIRARLQNGNLEEFVDKQLRWKGAAANSTVKVWNDLKDSIKSALNL